MMMQGNPRRISMSLLSPTVSVKLLQTSYNTWNMYDGLSHSHLYLLTPTDSVPRPISFPANLYEH